MGPWTYNRNNELESYGGVTLLYDENGNMLSGPTDAGDLTFVWDIENRLSEVRDSSNNFIATYYYDPFGRRLRKDVAGTRTYFVYSDEGLIGEYDSAGVEIKTYGYKPDGLWTTDPVFMKQGGEYYWYHNDHLGTPQMMTDRTGAIVWSAEYDVFGRADVLVAAVENNLRFPGQYYDAETNLHYNWMRYYDSQIGRYIRLDPIGLETEGVNVYLYSEVNPLNRFDPEGMLSIGDQPPSGNFKHFRPPGKLGEKASVWSTPWRSWRRSNRA